MEHNYNLNNITCNKTIDIKFSDLSYVVQPRFCGVKKHILKGLNGIFRSGELTAIMGPSGAGKTTLLNILSGFQQSLYTGTVEYINQGNKLNNDSYKKQLCYIQQANNLHHYFTTQQIMMIASYLKINRNLSHKSRQMLIDNILNTLILSSVKETRVKRLSGGEKKRLSIALEMIGNPLLMFLDEPTTGLDYMSSIQCMTVLKKLAQTGRTIICTIHQPSAGLYEMFDHIYLVVDGHCMYRSSPGDTVSYFARQGLQCPEYHNPADYMLEVVSKEYGNYNEQLIAAAKWSTESSNEKRLITSSRDTIQKIHDNNQMMELMSPPTELMRFWVLLYRYMISIYHNRKTEYIYLYTHIVIPILAGLLFMQFGDNGSKVINNFYFLLISVGYAYYVGFLPVVLKIPLEIKILRKERFNNWYQLRTWYIAMLVSTIPLNTFYSLLYSFTSYFMTNQPSEVFRFFRHFFLNTLTFFVSEGLGLVISAIFKPINGLFVGSILFSMVILFAGLFILLKEMSNFMYYISYLNLLRYAFHASIENIYGYDRKKLQCSAVYCHFRIPSKILEVFDITKPIFWFDVAILFGYYIAFRVLAYVLLKRQLSRFEY